jgi:hypothetical protein
MWRRRSSGIDKKKSQKKKGENIMNTEMKTWTIYTDDVEDEDLEAARESLLELYNEENPSDEDVWNEAIELKDTWLDAEKGNLNIATQNRLIAYGTLGLWTGNALCFSLLNNNVNSIFDAIHGMSGPTTATVYADAEDVQCREAHHDGVNLYTFRELLGNEEEVDELLDELRTAVYDNNADKFNELIQTRTKSIRPYVAKVYGW